MKIFKKILKFFGYFLGGIAAFVVVVIVALAILLRTEFFTGFVLGKVLPSVEESLGADIEVKTLQVSLFPTWVNIEGAHFTPAKGNFKRKFVSVNRIYLDVDTTALFTGRAVVEKLEIDGLVNYLFFKDGELANLPKGKPKPKKKKEPKPLVLK